MNCPRCADHPPLQPLRAGRTEVDVCGTCSGTFYDAGEFTQLEGLKLTGRLNPVDVALTCPRCGDQDMAEVIWPGSTDVAIDVCTGCRGFWVDQGEVRRIKESQKGPAVDEVTAPGRSHLMLRAQDHRNFHWRWVAIAAAILLLAQGAVAGLAAVFEGLAAIEDRDHSLYAQLSGHLLAFPLGGFITARVSSRFTVVEPAVAAVPAALVFALVTRGLVPTPILVGLVVAGMVLALAGAVLGERLF